MIVPLRLYKYEAVTLQTLLNLKGQVIYFGSPLAFNDPYDCALTPNFKDLNDEAVEELRGLYLKSKNLTAAARRELTASSIEKLKDNFTRAAISALTSNIDNFLKNRGVACFSEKNDDLLMWSHYGGKYRGICLEFNTQLPPFEKVKQVQYVETLPQLDVAEILLEAGTFDHIRDLYCTKSKSWSYESEWRAIHQVAGTEYIYPTQALTAVYFGPDIDKKSLEIVCLILKGQNESVRLFQGMRSTSKFRVEFNEFNYVSYVEAKKFELLD